MSKLVAFTLAAIGLMTVGCNGKDEVLDPTPLRNVEIMTYRGELQGMTILEMQKGAFGEIVKMAAPQRFTSSVVDGQRLLVSYTACVADTSQRPVPIQIEAAYSIVNGTAEMKFIDEIRKLPEAQVRVLSAWQTGDYLNMQTLVDYTGELGEYALVVDAATVGNKVVDCYLYNPGETLAPGVERRSYASFYVGDVARGKRLRLMERNAQK